MTNLQPNDIPARVLALLTAIAPDIDPASVDPELDFRDQFDFDSMDSLHLATAISEQFNIAIDEKDYSRLASLHKACDYVRGKLAGAQAGPKPAQP